MNHHCHAYNCTKTVMPKMFACRDHWRALRIDLRHAVMREFVPGQEQTKRPTLRYMAVQRLAVATLAFKPNDEQAARVSAGYMAEALNYRNRALAAGDGDPLDGLVPIEKRAA